MKPASFLRIIAIFVIANIAPFLTSCSPQPVEPFTNLPTLTVSSEELATSASLPTRPSYQPGELVNYIIQTGDTLPAIAAHFNTTEKEIRAANQGIPLDVTTLPPGMPVSIPIYFLSLWGTPYQIIPDSLFINGPAQRGFDTVSFVDSHPGWLKTYTDTAGGETHRGGELVDIVATNFSISPRLLLAMIEYQTGALSSYDTEGVSTMYPLGYADREHQGLYQQMVWAANLLNNTYYAWRMGTFSSFEHLDGSLERPDPWQNAATVALQFYYSRFFGKNDFVNATQSMGIARTYRILFGDPWQNVEPHIPVSLRQPAMKLPFEAGKSWAFTGGPHTGWGDGDPFAALDFAPPAVIGGCQPTKEWAVAVADGVIVRSAPAVVVLDLDGDGDERTGWVVFYLHLATLGRAPQGAILKTGSPIGFPSCEGGNATGTHVHIARKYNGEWIPAEGVLAFNLEGWIAKNGLVPYQGFLMRNSLRVRACECSDKASQLKSEQ